MILVEFLGLLVLSLGSIYFRLKNYIWLPIIFLYLYVITVYGATPFYLYTIYWVVFIVVAIVFNQPQLRQQLFSKIFFNYFKKVLPPISQTEQEALEAGDTWWEADLFQGNPDWQKMLAFEKPTLTAEEQQFIQEKVMPLCAMLDDWQIVNQHDLPEQIWQYLKTNNFFGLVIEKQYGGLGFSALAHSTIVAIIASRSYSAAINTMVPNSLGPGELLHRYGTEEQKQHYLPRLANGEDVPCFALTSLDAGSDAGAMIDCGVICKQQFKGQEVLGIKLKFSKRYITLAPVATVIGLAFKLYDPNKLLGDKQDLGITVALLPADLDGIEIGDRHLPMNLAFMNGPIKGTDVFIPLDYIIGGAERIGQGWRMLMECLSIGRSISLPALSAAGTALCYRATGAYARVRKQFRVPIGAFEGIALPMAEIASGNYSLLAMQKFTCGAVDQGIKPSVASAIAKYHSTELARTVMDHALDIHAGRGVQNGPSNYLAFPYYAIPVAITVEGANILTRNLIVFGQGAIRCHPFILQEMQAVQNTNLKLFDKLLVKHIAYAASNMVRTFVYGLTAGRFIKTGIKGELHGFSQQLTRMSTALAMSADLAMLCLGGSLKRKEALSARFGDVLSALYISSAVLKYFQDHGDENDLLIVQWTLTKQLANIQNAFDEIWQNFPKRWLAKTLKWFIFPYGRSYFKPNDKASIKLAEQMMQVSELRDRLTGLCYVGDQSQPLAILDQAMEMLIKVEPIEAKLRKAIKDGHVAHSGDLEMHIKDALVADILTSQEAQDLRDYEILRIKALAVDQFTAEELKSNNKG